MGQVRDIPPVRLEKVHWLLPKLRCGACGTVTTADPPGGRAGTVVCGPNVNAAVIVVDNEGNVPAERTAMLMGRWSARRSGRGSSPARMSGLPGGWKRRVR
jgi:hypothetical protein